jgi:hypothetical protein
MYVAVLMVSAVVDGITPDRTERAAQRAQAGDSALTFEPARGSAAGVHAVALPIA